MIAKVNGIKFDTDGVDYKDLPKRATIVVESEDDDIADILSDKYGFCVESIESVEFDDFPTLEKILKKYFNVKRPLNKNGDFTIAGKNAYKKLIKLLYDISRLTDKNVNDIVEILDSICDDDF